MENDKKAFNWKVVTVIVVVVLGGLYLNSKKSNSPQELNEKGFADKSETDMNSASSTPNTPSTSKVNLNSSVKIALLAMPAKDADTSKLKGCDSVSLVSRNITPTQAPLKASMQELFARKEPWLPTETSSGNFITSQKDLFFDKAVIENGVAKIYLTGKYTLAGVCDDPRTTTQITATAMQFPTVKSVQIFLNNAPFVIPSLKGE